MKKKPIKNQATRKGAAPPSKVSDKLLFSLGGVIAIVAFVFYAQSIQHDFTLDDSAVIQENTVTKAGLSGIPTILKTDYWYGSGHNISRGPIYRPTSLIIFATVWEFSPGNPHVYHFINILLYAATCVILFLVLCKVFKNQGPLFPFICALLYTAHPIHTEVVNNIKSMDEILCFLFGLISIGFFLRYISSASRFSLILAGISFFLSLISKETGITFLAIIPLTIFFFTDASLRKIITALVLLLALTAIWLIIRMAVFAELPANAANTAAVLNNTLNAAPDKLSKFATAFYILLRYILLLIFPHPLSYDYSFSQIEVQSLGSPGALVGIILYLGMAIYCLMNFRKKNIVTFGILFFLITLAPVSNLFLLVAATMAERFMYIPSLGFCIILGYVLVRLTREETTKNRFKNLFQFFALHQWLFLIVLGICALYFYKTVSRNRDWKDNLTLFSHDVKVSGNSARTNQTLGSALMVSVMKSPNKQDQMDTLRLAKNYLKRALEIYPDFYVPWSHLGVIYLFENKFDSAYDCFKRGLKIMPDDVDLNYNYGLTLFNLKRNDEAIKVLSRTIELSPKHEQAYYNLAALYQNTGNYDKALSNYSKALELNPNNANAYYYSGVILRSKGDTLKANQYINKARSLGYKLK